MGFKEQLTMSHSPLEPEFDRNGRAIWKPIPMGYSGGQVSLFQGDEAPLFLQVWSEYSHGRIQTGGVRMTLQDARDVRDQLDAAITYFSEREGKDFPDEET